MKVIFLDIDGVLVTGETVNTLIHVTEDDPFCAFARGPVYQLNRIVRETGAEIVISSSWRCDGPRWLALMTHFRQQGVEKEPIGRTIRLRPRRGESYVQRGKEIKVWLSNDVTEYVALDDDCDMDDIPGHFVYIKNGMWRGGLLAGHAELAIAILNRPKVPVVPSPELT